MDDSTPRGNASRVCIAYFLNARPAHIAQSVEHFLGKEEVTGSSPVMGSNWMKAGTLRVFVKDNFSIVQK